MPRSLTSRARLARAIHMVAEKAPLAPSPTRGRQSRQHPAVVGLCAEALRMPFEQLCEWRPTGWGRTRVWWTPVQSTVRRLETGNRVDRRPCGNASWAGKYRRLSRLAGETTCCGLIVRCPSLPALRPGRGVLCRNEGAVARGRRGRGAAHADDGRYVMQLRDTLPTFLS